MTRASLFALGALALFSSLGAADDWPQWMGPNRDGVWAETGITRSLPKSDPKNPWKPNR